MSTCASRPNDKFLKVLSRPVPCIQLSRHGWLMLDVDSLIVDDCHVSVVFLEESFQFHPSAMNVNELKFITQIVTEARRGAQWPLQLCRCSPRHQTNLWMSAAHQIEVFVLGKANVIIRTWITDGEFFWNCLMKTNICTWTCLSWFKYSRSFSKRLPPPPNKRKCKTPPPPKITDKYQRTVKKNVGVFAQLLEALKRKVDAEDVLWAFRGIRRQVVWSLRTSTRFFEAMLLD